MFRKNTTPSLGITNNVEIKVRFHESKDPEAWKDDDGKHFPDRTSDSEKAKSAFSILESTNEVKFEFCQGVYCVKETTASIYNGHNASDR